MERRRGWRGGKGRARKGRAHGCKRERVPVGGVAGGVGGKSYVEKGREGDEGDRARKNEKEGRLGTRVGTNNERKQVSVKIKGGLCRKGEKKNKR